METVSPGGRDEDRDSRIRLRLPVTVLMERHVVARKFWSVPTWRLHGVVSGQSLTHESAGGSKVRDTADGGELWSWSGYQTTLYKDACERYWHALIGDKPLVYVVCRESPDSDTALEPLVVTVDYDEATAYAETDELVLSAPIPGDLYRYMEAFVLEHYRPQKIEKRKRRNWSEKESSGPRNGGPRSAGASEGDSPRLGKAGPKPGGGTRH